MFQACQEGNQALYLFVLKLYFVPLQPPEETGKVLEASFLLYTWNHIAGLHDQSWYFRQCTLSQYQIKAHQGTSPTDWACHLQGTKTIVSDDSCTEKEYKDSVKANFHWCKIEPKELEQCFVNSQKTKTLGIHKSFNFKDLGLLPYHVEILILIQSLDGRSLWNTRCC